MLDKKIVEYTKLRCYDCNYEFLTELKKEDNISDLNCPKCHKNTVEVNFGKTKSNSIEMIKY